MKFSIRDLLWLTVVVALAVSWWLDHSRLAMELESALRWDVQKWRQVTIFSPDWPNH